MALGDTYNNNQQQSKPSVNVTSGYRWYNDDSTIDPSRLTAKMWGNSLQLEIAPKKAESSGDFSEYDDKNSVKIYLNHTKAKILYNEIIGFMTDPSGRNSSGVPSGTGIITISDGSEFGAPGKTCLVIRRLDPETGEVDSSFAYEFRTNYHYAIRNYNADTKEFDKEFEDYNDLELGQLVTLLEQYFIAMTNATAFSIMNAMNYDYKTNAKLDAICEALNVSTGKGSNSNAGRSRSYFDSNNSRSNSGGANRTKDYNDIESALNLD